MSPFQAKYGAVPVVTIFHVFGYVAFVHVAEALRDSTFADKAYKGYFVGLKWPLLDRFLIFVPTLNKVVESAHILFDEVTQVTRPDDDILVVDEKKREVKDFHYLMGLAYADDESGVTYVTTRVTTQRGFIVAFRAAVIDGRQGKEEPRPIHARDVELMLQKHWETHTPMMWRDNALTRICHELQGAPARMRTDHPQGSLEPGHTGPRDQATGTSVDARDEPPRERRTDPPSSGPAPTDGRARRERAQRQPLNVGTMGDIGSDRALYLAVQDIADEDDDALPIWNDAKVDEMRSLVLEHDAYKVVPLPPGRKAIKSKWVVKQKPDKLKARFTPKGCSQKQGVDYKETWAPVAKLVTLRVFLCLVAILQLSTGQLDLKTAFLNASLEEEIYCEPIHDQVSILQMVCRVVGRSGPHGAIDRIMAQIRALRAGGVLLLRKAVYGLKQAPRAWWSKLHAFLQGLGFKANRVSAKTKNQSHFSVAGAGHHLSGSGD